MSIRVVVGDLHGNHEALRLLLRKVGAIDDAGARVPDHFVVHIGDLINAVQDSRAADDEIASLHGWFDIMIPGNHDLWWYSKHPAGRFGGLDSMVPQLHVDQRQAILDSGKLKAAYYLDGWLLTHAGLHVAYQHDLDDEFEAAAYLHTKFQADPEADVFTATGPYRSGGLDPRPGGVFWCDWMELTSLPSRLRQIVGHTPQPEGPVYHAGPQPIWSVDIGAKIGPRAAAIVKDEGEDDWHPVKL